MLCGGDGQQGNGFEIWRNLHYGKCEDERRLLKHCADWEEALAKYGGALRNDPISLRTMFLSIIPKAMEEKMMSGSKPTTYPTWQSVHKWIKEQFEGRRKHAIANALHAPAGPQGHINAMGIEQPQQEIEPSGMAPHEGSQPGWSDISISAGSDASRTRRYGVRICQQSRSSTTSTGGYAKTQGEARKSRRQQTTWTTWRCSTEMHFPRKLGMWRRRSLSARVPGLVAHPG